MVDVWFRCIFLQKQFYILIKIYFKCVSMRPDEIGPVIGSRNDMRWLAMLKL